MNSKPPLLPVMVLCLTMLACACGRSKRDADTEEASPKRSLGLFSDASRHVISVGDDYGFVDHSLNKLLVFSAEPFALKSSWDIASDQERQWIFSTGGSSDYLLSVTSTEYVISKTNGASSVGEFPARVLSALYHPDTHTLLAVLDDGESQFIRFTSSGEVSSTYKGDSAFDLGDSFLAATFLEDGRVVAAIGEAKLAIIDAGETLAQQSWQQSSFTLSASGSISAPAGISFLSAVAANSNYVMAKEASRVLLIDISSQALVSSKSLPVAAHVSVYFRSRPHLLAVDSAAGTDAAYRAGRLYYVDDSAVLNEKFISLPAKELVSSHFDLSNEKLTLRLDGVGEDVDGDQIDSYVYRLNTARGSLDSVNNVLDDVRLAFSGEYMIFHYDSPLGYAERRRYGDHSDTVVLERFNLDSLRDRYALLR